MNLEDATHCYVVVNRSPAVATWFEGDRKRSIVFIQGKPPTMMPEGSDPTEDEIDFAGRLMMVNWLIQFLYTCRDT